MPTLSKYNSGIYNFGIYNLSDDQSQELLLQLVRLRGREGREREQREERTPNRALSVVLATLGHDTQILTFHVRGVNRRRLRPGGDRSCVATERS